DYRVAFYFLEKVFPIPDEKLLADILIAHGLEFVMHNVNELSEGLELRSQGEGGDEKGKGVYFCWRGVSFAELVGLGGPPDLPAEDRSPSGRGTGGGTI